MIIVLLWWPWHPRIAQLVKGLSCNPWVICCFAVSADVSLVWAFSKPLTSSKLLVWLRSIAVKKMSYVGPNQWVSVKITPHLSEIHLSLLIKGWMMRQFFWLIRISVSQNLPESNKSSYWAGDVVKNTVKSWNSQINFHSVEIFPRDINCCKRHHSGSTLLHMRTCDG